MKVELKQFGEDIGFELPEELVNRLGFLPGIELTITELPDGRLLLALAQPDSDRT